MQIVRILVKGRAKYGMLKGDVVHGFSSNPFAQSVSRSNQFEQDGSTYKLSDVKLLAPCLPSKIVCLGLNYRSHAEETKLPIPSVPLIFLKPPSALIGPEDKIVLPRGYGRVDYEGELGIVIGNKAKDVIEDRVYEYICFAWKLKLLWRVITGFVKFPWRTFFWHRERRYWNKANFWWK